MKIYLAINSLLITLTIAGCVTEKVISIQSGITTKKYVESNFGKPTRIEKDGDRENWYYDNFETAYNPNIPFNYPKEMQTYYVQFDKRGKVAEDYLIVQPKKKQYEKGATPFLIDVRQEGQMRWRQS